jgi:hypothetical protein
MPPITEAVETVVIRGGLAVPLASLQVLWDLEARGFSVVAIDGSLRVSPRSRITPSDDIAIRRHRDELVALIAHCGAVQ